MTWKKSNGKWALSLGHRGHRVRIFQREPGGVFYRDVWGDGRINRRSLLTTERTVAEARGRALLAALLVPPQEPRAEDLTLGQLWRAFERECAAWRDNVETLKRDDRYRAEVLLAVLGANTLVKTLSANDCTRYAAIRRAGGVEVGDRVTRHVRQRTVHADLVLLKQWTRWATVMKRSNGEPWIEKDPLAGVVLTREPDVRRPVATRERYEATREVLQRWREAQDPEQALRGWYVDTALVLAYRLGRRISAIRSLRWEDVRWDTGDVVWRAATDKRRKTAVRPLPPDVVDHLRSLQRRTGAIGGPIFARAAEASTPYDRHWFDKWLVRAEQEAELPKLEGSTWHAYRRRWASDRADQGLKGVMEYAGWSDMKTVLQYQQLDRDQLLQVVGTSREIAVGR